MPNITELKECPDCASSNIVHNLEREQLICRECGLIYEPLSPADEMKFEETHGLTQERPKLPVRKAKAPKKTVKKPAKKKK